VSKGKTTWWYKPRSPQIRDLESELRTLDGIGFERLVTSMFARIPNWKAQWNGGSHDHGADVVVTSSTGIRYAIQCKKYISTLDNTPVQEVIGSLAVYGAQVGIVLTTGPGYTAGAKALATANGVMLWSMNELEAIAVAEASQDETVLQSIGLQILARTTQTPIVQTRVPQWVQIAAMVGTLIIAVAVAPKFIKTNFGLASAYTSLNPDEVTTFIREYDTKYQDLLKTNDLNIIPQILLGLQANEVKRNIGDRQRKGCYRSTSVVKPLEIRNLWQYGADLAIADVWKHWEQYDVCFGVSKLVVWKPFIATYTMIKDSGVWKVAKTNVSENL
jgi:hypothetical protein